MLRSYTAIILFLLVSIITSCKNSKPEPFILPQGIQDLMQAVAMDKIHAWQGNINGTTPVIIWYKQNENALAGSIVYTEKKDGPIPIIGIIRDSVYAVAEIGKTPANILTFKVMGISIEGTYSSARTGITQNISMLYTDTAVTISPFSATDVISQFNSIKN
jgi:hypothetical protein